ncbi:MAG: hypothetical protein IPN17_37235 [Deltaproteobacteria bacterium]|nr:hypothetical protein [Deltaproteobacteria bacterium]
MSHGNGVAGLYVEGRHTVDVRRASLANTRLAEVTSGQAGDGLVVGPGDPRGHAAHVERQRHHRPTGCTSADRAATRSSSRTRSPSASASACWSTPPAAPLFRNRGDQNLYGIGLYGAADLIGDLESIRGRETTQPIAPALADNP